MKFMSEIRNLSDKELEKLKLQLSNNELSQLVSELEQHTKSLESEYDNIHKKRQIEQELAYNFLVKLWKLVPNELRDHLAPLFKTIETEIKEC